MMKASFTGSYDGDNSDATGSVVLNAGDINFRASISGINSFINKPSLNGLSLSIENPGSFTVNYNVPKKDVKFQFMESVRVNGKPLSLTYTHSLVEKRTELAGTLALDCKNKVSTNYGFDTGDCKMKYSYVHGGVMTIEPQFDFVDKSWELAVSRRIGDDSVVRGSYRSDTSVLGLDLTKNSFGNGGFKVSASVNLADEKKTPRITAESIWDFEL